MTSVSLPLTVWPAQRVVAVAWMLSTGAAVAMPRVVRPPVVASVSEVISPLPLHRPALGGPALRPLASRPVKPVYADPFHVPGDALLMSFVSFRSSCFPTATVIGPAMRVTALAPE